MVRRTESRLPFKMKASELGEASETLNKNAYGVYTLVSFLSSPIIKGTPNNYVVFVEKATIIPEKYIWQVENSGTKKPLENGETEIGCWQFTPPADDTELNKIKVQVTVKLPEGNSEVIQLSLEQTVTSPWSVISQLTVGANAISEKFASTYCFHPGAVRELLENFSGYIEYAALREKIIFPSETPNSEADLKPTGIAIPASLLAAVVYRDILLRPGAFGTGAPLAFLKQRAEADERLTRHMNSDDWSDRLKSLHGCKIGVCGISLLTAALSLGLIFKEGKDYAEYINGITDEKNQDLNRKLFISMFQKSIAADATAGVDLFNLLRFPKSNIFICLHILNDWKSKIEKINKLMNVELMNMVWKDLELMNMDLNKISGAMALLADAYHYFPFFSDYDPSTHIAQSYGASVIRLLLSPLIQSFFTSSHEAHIVPFKYDAKAFKEIKEKDFDALGKLIKDGSGVPVLYNIAAVQSDLYRLGLIESEYINGYYGPETVASVTKLQLLALEAGELQKTGYNEGCLNADTSKALRRLIVKKAKK